jgi:hypothetical protein
MTGVDATAIKPAIAATCKLTIMAPPVTQRNETEVSDLYLCCLCSSVAVPLLLAEEGHLRAA